MSRTKTERKAKKQGKQRAWLKVDEENKIVEYVADAHWFATAKDNEMMRVLADLMKQAEPHRQAGYDVRDMPKDA